MRIEAMDVRDRQHVDAVIAVLAAAHPVDFPDDPPFCPSWDRGRLTHPLPASTHEQWLAVGADREVLGVLMLDLPQLDNVTTALGELTVHPDARRRGIGTALAAQARERALAHGRKLLIAWSTLGGTAEQFLQRNGYSIGLTEHRQLLVVTPERQASWHRLHEESLPHAAGYRLARWQDETPEQHAGGIAYLTHRMSTDAPLGELQWEAEAWDADRVLITDAVMPVWGMRCYT
ncbi:MAG: GNAT family N-acetyltransferase, partial [Thermocrispum sp.]